MFVRRRLRYLAALVLPLVALALSWFFHRQILPFVFLLLYPAAFFSAYLGGLYPGLLATAISTAGAAYVYLATAQTAHPAVGDIAVPLAVFAAMGAAFSFTSERMGRAMSIVASVLHAHGSGESTSSVLGSRDLVQRLSKLVEERAQIQAELERTQTAYRDQEHHLEGILDNVPALVAYWDQDLILRFANHTYLDWFGIDPDWSRGKHVVEIFGAETFAAREQHFLRALAGEQQEFQATVHGTNQDRNVLLHYVPDTVDGTVRGIYVLGTDVTRLHAATTALQETTAMLTAFADNIPALVGYIDTDNRFVYANRQYGNWFERPQEEMAGISLRELIGDEAFAISEPYTRRALGGERVSFERTLILKGAPVGLDVSMLPRLADDGSVMGYFVISLDITQRKQAQRALEEQNRRLEELVTERTTALQTREHELRAILDSIPAMISHWDRDERNLLANKAHIDWLGRTPESMVGHSLSEIGEPAYSARKPHIDRVLRGSTERFEVDVRHPVTSQLRRGLITYVPDVREGTVQGFFALVDDVTDLRHTQQALEEARNVAERASRAKADFLANMSHEIRTPMNAVLGFAYLLQKAPIPTDAKDLVRKISASGRVLLGIINDILDFSKIEAGRLELEHLPFRLSAVLDDLSGIISSVADGKHIELIVDTPDHTAEFLQGDPLRLGQVLLNLASNAIKFTEKGHVWIKTRVVASTPDRITVRFDVEDTGIGIAASKLHEIFAPFSQAETSTTRRFGGTGLGLTITRRLIELMGGSVEVSSTPGLGSRFTVILPFERSAEHAYSSPELSHQHVLVADDHPVAREVLGAAVIKLGWSPKLADSGQAAIALVEKQHRENAPFDVLLLDMRMDPVDGLSAAKHVRSTYPGPQMPIIIMVTADDRATVNALPDFQCVDGLVTKPVTASALYDAVLVAKRHREKLGGEVGRGETASMRLVGLRVLVVDDSELNCEVAREILESEGARVSIAFDGQHALDWLRAHPTDVDVVLMDVQMPLMDGYETVRRLRGDLAMTALPVFALTAGAYRADEEAALEAGMNGFFAKPFDVDELVGALRAIHTGGR